MAAEKRCSVTSGDSGRSWRCRAESTWRQSLSSARFDICCAIADSFSRVFSRSLDFSQARAFPRRDVLSRDNNNLRPSLHPSRAGRRTADSSIVKFGRSAPDVVCCGRRNGCANRVGAAPEEYAGRNRVVVNDLRREINERGKCMSPWLVKTRDGLDVSLLREWRLKSKWIVHALERITAVLLWIFGRE